MVRFPASVSLIVGLVAILCPSVPAPAAEPVIRMLVPGFTIDEVPVQLPNLNNLRFAPDGSLTALGYNGRIWKLTDSNGDGLEDTATPWWDRDTLTVPVGMCWTSAGLLVSSSGKVSLLRDTRGEGRADTEEILTQGWTPKDTASGNVDATGVTLGADGKIYFALLTANYANPYRLKKVKDLTPAEKTWWLAHGPGVPVENRNAKLEHPESEVSLYDVDGERGTVQQLDLATGRRETFTTGMRVVYHLAFNQAGDLFCSDQEGETWCPNGNPLDELNHLVVGRNYGFPPRHEHWLPELISESPVVAFGPQHQSTCGFTFNEPRVGSAPSDPTPKTIPTPITIAQGLFGPNAWRDEALVTGESRGKLWRVHLEKTAHGYIGKEHLIARLSMLTLDVAISPNGDLYVCCHSGLPDWGTGPTGLGKIFRIRYTDRSVPQPIDVVGHTNRVEVKFDRPIAPTITRAVPAPSIESGETVRAADRFETLKPPYQAVNLQETALRTRTAVQRTELSGDGTVLTLFPQSPLQESIGHSLILAGLKSADPAASTPRESESSTIELDFTFGPPRTPFAKSAESLSQPSLSMRASSRPVGDFESGRELFTQLQCVACHRLRGEGSGNGPELDNLNARDVESILVDIREPSARINPDYVGYEITLADGTTLTGFVRPKGNDRLQVLAANGAETLVKPTEVKEMRPSAQSLMPTGLLDPLKDSQVNDLLTFLRHAAPVREPAAIQQVLHSVKAAPGLHPPLRVVLVASKQDHGLGQHDYPRWQTNWVQWLGSVANTELAWEWPSPAQFATADVLLLYFWNHDWSAQRLAEIDSFQRRGGGVVLLHSACIADQAPEALAERFGLSSQPGRTGYRHMPFELNMTPDHPLTRGVPRSLPFLDEPYWPLVGDPARVTVLGTSEVDGSARPLVWTFERPLGGRVFGSILGHYFWTLDDPWFRILVLRGVAWAGQRDPDTLLSAVIQH